MTLPAIKNLIYNAAGTVDMEINHSTYGWIEFTANPNDTEQLGRDLYAAAIAGTLGAIAPYVAPPRFTTLADAKVGVTADIVTARDVARFANVDATIGGISHSWQADASSLALLNGAVSLAQAGGALPPVWRTADNINVTIATLADLVAIADAISTQTNNAYAKSWTLKGQIDAVTITTTEADAIAQVEAVVW